MKTKISIVTVCYNAEDSIRKTMESVINQDYEHTEYVVIDGNSSDGTFDVIKEYKDKIDVLVRESDNGIYDAMNKSLSHVSGDWLIFMNAGDIFYNNRVLSNIAWDSVPSKIGVVYGDYISIRKSTQKTILCNNPFTVSRYPYKSMGFHHQSCFVRTSVAKVLKFDTSFKCCADYRMIFCIVKKEEYNLLKIDDIISIVDDSQGFSFKNRLIQIKEHGRACEWDSKFEFKLFYIAKRLIFFIKKRLHIL